MPMATPEAQREYQRKWKAARRAKWFADKVCLVCGTTEQLELDHIDASTKISSHIWSWSWARIEEETAKCQVLCRMHHLEKTIKNKEHARGEASGNARFTDEDVRLIRNLRAEGWTYQAISDLYGITNSKHVWYVVNQGWQHIDN